VGGTPSFDRGESCMKKIYAGYEPDNEQLSSEQLAYLESAGGIQIAGGFAERAQAAYKSFSWRMSPAASITEVKSALEKLRHGAIQAQAVMRDWASIDPAYEVARNTIGPGLQFDPDLQHLVAHPAEFRRLESIMRRLAAAADDGKTKLPKNKAGRQSNASIGDFLVAMCEIFVAAGGRSKKLRAFERAVYKVAGHSTDHAPVAGKRLRDQTMRKQKATVRAK
jgi:hypothetical protein